MRKFKPPMLSIDIPEETPNLSINELIQKTFHVFPDDTPIVIDSKTKMQEIAQTLAKEMQFAIQNNVMGSPKEDAVVLSVKHRQQNAGKQEIVFDRRMGEPFAIEVFPPVAEIYEIIDNPNVIIKQLSAVPNGLSIEATQFLIIREFTFQIYANQISEKCGIVVPQILGQKFYVNNEGYLIAEFVMPFVKRIPAQELIEWIDHKSSEQKIDEILKLIHNVKNSFECLRAHSIYHNDSHSDNVFFVYWENGEYRLCVIDFGKTTCIQTVPSTTGLTIKSSEGSDVAEIIADFRNWANLMNMNPNIVNSYKTNTMDKYGGILKKGRKTKKKTKKTKKIKKIKKKRNKSKKR